MKDDSIDIIPPTFFSEPQPNWDDDDGNLEDDEETELKENADSDDDDDDLEEDEWDGEPDPDDENNYGNDEDELAGHWSGEFIYGQNSEMSEFENAYYARDYAQQFRPENIYTDDGDDFENV